MERLSFNLLSEQEPGASLCGVLVAGRVLQAAQLGLCSHRASRLRGESYNLGTLMPVICTVMGGRTQGSKLGQGTGTGQTCPGSGDRRGNNLLYKCNSGERAERTPGGSVRLVQ